MPAAATKRASGKLRLSDTAKKLGSKFCDQLLEEGFGFHDALLLSRAIICRQAMVRSEFVLARSADSIGMDRSHFSNVYNATTLSLFPEDEESRAKSIRDRLRAKRKPE